MKEEKRTLIEKIQKQLKLKLSRKTRKPRYFFQKIFFTMAHPLRTSFFLQNDKSNVAGDSIP